MINYVKNKLSNITKRGYKKGYIDGFTDASELMPKLLVFYSDNFRRTDQDFDKVVSKFYEKLNK